MSKMRLKTFVLVVGLFVMGLVCGSLLTRLQQVRQLQRSFDQPRTQVRDDILLRMLDRRIGLTATEQQQLKVKWSKHHKKTQQIFDRTERDLKPVMVLIWRDVLETLPSHKLERARLLKEELERINIRRNRLVPTQVTPTVDHP